MDYDKHSYSYEDNDDTSFTNDEASFSSYNEYDDYDNHRAYEHTNTYINAKSYSIIDDESVKLAPDHLSTKYAL